MMYGGIKVIKSVLAPKFNSKGPVLCTTIELPTLNSLAPQYTPNSPSKTETTILVHPDRWEEFILWINNPDIASHPELRAWFRERDSQ